MKQLPIKKGENALKKPWFKNLIIFVNEGFEIQYIFQISYLNVEKYFVKHNCQH